MHLNHRPAQSMLELVMALGIIVVSVITATTLIVATIGAGRASQNRIEAANLAREGVEIVRGIRDANWIRRAQNVTDKNGNIYAWDMNPLYASTCVGAACPDNFMAGSFWVWFAPAGTQVENHLWQLRKCADPCTPPPVRYSPTNQVFTQGPCDCQNTRFSRVVTITKLTDMSITLGTVEYLDVVSTVSWQERNRTRSLSARQRFYDWQ